jgi:hypothetical protein
MLPTFLKAMTALYVLTERYRSTQTKHRRNGNDPNRLYFS